MYKDNRECKVNVWGIFAAKTKDRNEQEAKLIFLFLRRACRIDDLTRQAMVHGSRFLNFNFILCNVRGRPVTLLPSSFSSFSSI